MKILLVDGTIFGRKTGVLLEQVQQYIHEMNEDLELEILYFSKLKHQILDGSPLNDDMKMMMQKFEEADGLISGYICLGQVEQSTKQPAKE